MPTKKVIDMTARSSSSLAYNDFVYLTKEVPLTDEKMQASVMRDYVLSGVKTSANSGLAQTSTSYAAANPDYELTLDVNNLAIVTPVAGDYISIEDITDNTTKKVLVSAVVGLASGTVTSVTGGTNLTASPTTGATIVNLDATLTGLTSVTSTDFVGDLTGDVTGDVTGDLTGDVTGDVTGDLTGDVTGDVTGDLTGTASIATALAATLGVTAGGTGLITVAKGSVLAVNAADTISAVAGVTNGHVLTYDSAADTVGWAAPGHATGTVTSVAISGTDGIDVDSGSPITTSGTITLGLSGIANSALTNSSVSYGGVSVSLGGTDATPAFDLADATNYEGDAVLSTGETGTAKFLRVDGDNSSSWQVPPDTNTTYTAGDGLDLSVGNEFSADLKTNGGIVIESTELALDIGASSITGTLAVDDGGTGQTSYTNGQLLIGNTTGNTLAKATLTAGTNITITEGAGSITIAAAAGGDPAGTAVAMAIALGG
tara:strand:+ start:2200 stop:3660 length:1461 start_codon:yes stop_codon:yes gene_type:complete